MLTMDGTTTQKPEKMTSYTLEDGSDILGPPKDEYVQVLRNMIKGKVSRSNKENKRLTKQKNVKSTKIGIIKPPNKGEGKEMDDPKFYRPVSLLPEVGRIVESLKVKQMQAYRETLEIIPPEMHGYSSNMGTTAALQEMGEHVHKEVSLCHGHLGWI